MSRTISSALRGSVVEEEVELTAIELGRACRTTEQQIEVWVSEGVLQPSGETREAWRFGGDSLAAHAPGDAPDAGPRDQLAPASPSRSICSTASPSSNRACGADRACTYHAPARTSAVSPSGIGRDRRPGRRLRRCRGDDAAQRRRRAVARADRSDRRQPRPQRRRSPQRRAQEAGRDARVRRRAPGDGRRSTSAPAAATRPSCSRAPWRRAAASTARRTRLPAATLAERA